MAKWRRWGTSNRQQNTVSGRVCVSVQRRYKLARCGSWLVMTALTVMGYGCAASHRDWRRITLGSSGSPNQIGYIDLAPWGQPGFVWGSTNNRFVGTNR